MESLPGGPGERSPSMRLHSNGLFFLVWFQVFLSAAQRGPMTFVVDPCGVRLTPVGWTTQARSAVSDLRLTSGGAVVGYFQFIPREFPLLAGRSHQRIKSN